MPTAFPKEFRDDVVAIALQRGSVACGDVESDPMLGFSLLLKRQRSPSCFTFPSIDV